MRKIQTGSFPVKHQLLKKPFENTLNVGRAFTLIELLMVIAIIALLAALVARDYSYAMNCEICHTTDLSAFVEPSKTLLFMEAVLQTNDFSGMVGQSRGVSQSLALRHNGRGHLVMADLRVETMDRKAF